MSERSLKTRPQCGLCNAVSNVFRRLLCVGPSRRGSSESYYQQLDAREAYEPEQEDPITRETEPELSIDPNDQIVYINISDTQSNTSLAQQEYKCLREKSLALTLSELMLIKKTDKHQNDMKLTGRFLTIHKRRRKKLITRSLLPDVAPALLDDVHHGLVQSILDRVSQWPFNAFTLDVATGGRSLPVLCVHLFHWYGLLDFFNLDVVDVWKLFSLIEEGYHSTNPYHNAIHATDVTQAMHCFLQEEKIKKHVTPLEVMASLIAAVSHDLDHPGVNQPFLIATSNHLAALYQNTSVLENHHWRSAIGCLLESHVADKLQNIMPELEKQISSLILATDITRQDEFLFKFEKYLEHNSLQMEKEEDRHFILQIALKCADISNPCRPWEISHEWSQKVCDEFFRQGDYERQLGLPLTTLCDRYSSSVPKIQTGFFSYVVNPLFNKWHRFLATELSTNMTVHLKTNEAKWKELSGEEIEKKEEPNKILDIEEVLADTVNVDENQIDSRRCSLPSVMLETVDRTGRRHSVPLNLSRDSLALNTSSSRRESLPVSVSAEPRHKVVLGTIPHLEEEDEELDKSLSSCSGSIHKSSDCGSNEERQVSAESLLPETSIATMTSSLEPTKLSNVLHGSAMLAPPIKILTRQQTFPPIQTFVRTRYLSTAGETVVHLNASNSSSTDSSRNELSRNTRTGSLSSETGDVYLKRESSLSDSDRERNSNKMSKCSEKENVNPRKERDFKNEGNLLESIYFRRGSAPIFQEGSSSSREVEILQPRRGSVPTESSKLDLLEIPRRSSDGVTKSKRSNRNRKSLKRRSSGGPDVLLPREKFNTPRRGSLPCDVLPTFAKNYANETSKEK